MTWHTTMLNTAAHLAATNATIAARRPLYGLIAAPHWKPTRPAGEFFGEPASEVGDGLVLVAMFQGDLSSVPPGIRNRRWGSCAPVVDVLAALISPYRPGTVANRHCESTSSRERPGFVGEWFPCAVSMPAVWPRQKNSERLRLGAAPRHHL
jgi:hypothetical protein